MIVQKCGGISSRTLGFLRETKVGDGSRKGG
jgi:hypothetical protein